MTCIRGKSPATNLVAVCVIGANTIADKMMQMMPNDTLPDTSPTTAGGLLLFTR
jgi:hypothetical protein